MGDELGTFEDTVKQYTKLMYYIINKWPYVEKEEAYNIALFGLWKAWKFYNGKTKFITYASAVIYNEFRVKYREDMDKRAKFRNSFVSIDYLFSNSEDGYSSSLQNILSVEDESYLDIENREIVERVLSKLRPSNKPMYKLHLQGYRQRDICKKLNRLPSAVNMEIKRVKGYLKKEYDKEVKDT